MNPHGYRPNEFFAAAMIFEGLVDWDPEAREGADGIPSTADDFVVGSLATSWTTSEIEHLARPDTVPYSITFKLREGVTFHDGAKWDAATASLNFDHIMGGKEKAMAGFHDWSRRRALGGWGPARRPCLGSHLTRHLIIIKSSVIIIKVLLGPTPDTSRVSAPRVPPTEHARNTHTHTHTHHARTHAHLTRQVRNAGSYRLLGGACRVRIQDHFQVLRLRTLMGHSS